MTKIRIKIDRETINASKSCQKKSNSCLFAKALHPLFPEAIVGYSYMMPSKRAQRAWDKQFNTAGADLGMKAMEEAKIVISLPMEIEKMITLFDNTKNEDMDLIPEQEFELDIPDWAIEEAVDISELETILSNSKTLELV